MTAGSRLVDKITIVTGAAAGLGLATAKRFVAEGAFVYLVDRTSDVEGTAAELGERAAGSVADVTSAGDMEALARQAIADHGRIDVVFANAGIEGVGTADSLSEEVWRRVIDIDLMGVWLSSKYVLPHMVKQGGGSIINTASTGGLIGVPGIMPYAAAKGGVIALTRQMTVDYAPKGIRVNAICPGVVITDLVLRNWAEKGQTIEDHRANIAARYPLGRAGTPEDIANAALFLASDEAAWITGHSLVVDGGMTAI